MFEISSTTCNIATNLCYFNNFSWQGSQLPVRKYKPKRALFSSFFLFFSFFFFFFSFFFWVVGFFPLYVRSSWKVWFPCTQRMYIFNLYFFILKVSSWRIWTFLNQWSTCGTILATILDFPWIQIYRPNFLHNTTHRKMTTFNQIILA